MRALNCIVLILSGCLRASHTQFNGPAMVVIEIVEVDEEAPRDGTGWDTEYRVKGRAVCIDLHRKRTNQPAAV